MMNIRDFIFINKAKTVNKIRILEILGFDANSEISHSPEIIEEINNNLITSEIENEDILEIQETKTDFYTYNDDFNLNDNILEKTTTKTFEPIKITSQIKKLWTDIESRRQWVVPATLIGATIVLIITASSLFINNRNKETDIENLYLTLTVDSNNLVNQLEDIINISTDNFYSKYDVSNSSANLQLIESKIMEYERNLVERNDIENSTDLLNNLNNIFILVNDLDDLISYRILLSEILIYDDLLLITDEIDIESLSNELSEISATSKLNFEKLPSIDEFTNHNFLLKETLNSAENLHGRLIASLRNNENDIAKTLIVAINMNKQIEQDSFNEALNLFKKNKINLYKSLDTLP